MENPIVKVEHLYHRYTTTRWAIEDIDFEINGSGVVGLLGSNGIIRKSKCSRVSK